MSHPGHNCSQVVAIYQVAWRICLTVEDKKASLSACQTKSKLKSLAKGLLCEAIVSQLFSWGLASAKQAGVIKGGTHSRQ